MTKHNFKPEPPRWLIGTSGRRFRPQQEGRIVMSIDFTLTPVQQKLQKLARAFSEDVLKPVVQEADLEPDTQKAFQMMKGPALQGGLQAGLGARCYCHG
jgi:hypothetical protein